MMTQILFCYCAVMITGTGLLAVSLRNPVHCVLMVLVLFFHMACLYLTLNAEFLAAVQVIVYAGAVLVLYLFVLFLVSLREELHLDPFIPRPWVGRGIALGIGLVLLFIIPGFTAGEKGFWPLTAVREVTHTKALGYEMYSTYLLPFEVAGLILLVALIGGIVLARRDQPPPEEEPGIDQAAGGGDEAATDPARPKEVSP